MADSFLNKSGVSHLWEKIKAALGDKADKSTTVAGYGITNAYTKTEVDTKVNAKANSATTLNGYGITDAYTKTEVNTELNKKENTSNKVTSWQSTTDDTHYPSEKLVKTALDGKANSSHTHAKSQITDFPSSMPASDVYSWAKASSKPSYSTSEISGLQSALDGKAAKSHTHAISDVTNLQSTLNGKSNTSHTHDDRYYTESEVDKKLALKQNLMYTEQTTITKTVDSGRGSTAKNAFSFDITLPSMNIGDCYQFPVSLQGTNGSGTSLDNESIIRILAPSGGTYYLLQNNYSFSLINIASTSSKEVYMATSQNIINGGSIIYSCKKLANVARTNDYNACGVKITGTCRLQRLT